MYAEIYTEDQNTDINLLGDEMKREISYEAMR